MNVMEEWFSKISFILEKLDSVLGGLRSAQLAVVRLWRLGCGLEAHYISALAVQDVTIVFQTFLER